MNKRLVSFLLSLTLLTGLLSGCDGGKGGNGNPSVSDTKTKKNVNHYEGYYQKGESVIQMEEVDYQEISYVSKTYGTPDTGVSVNLKSKETGTGEAVSANVKAGNVGKYIYYIVDWGDGTRSFQGPYNGTSSGSITHKYNKAGKYEIRAAAQAIMRPSDTTTGWSEPVTVTVSGDAVTPSYVKNVRTITNGADWKGLEFDKYYTLDTLLFVFEEGKPVPTDFSVEYTTDRGENWYSLPRYYYTYEYYAEHGHFYKNFTAESLDMDGAAILLDMGGITANGVRVRSRDTINTSAPVSIGEMRVTSSQDGLFYTSYGGMRDADLNNMFVIYGTADTEPTYYWADPFRSGELLLGSTEWIHWNGIKLRWCADDSIFSQYKGLFASIRSGKDTWSDAEDGFIWATGSAQKHLDMQSHYTQNSLFIIEARNYLFMHNSTDTFMNSKNAQRQTIEQRIDASMNYLLETLDGKSGILTIRDPENLVEAGYKGGSQSSNYWDRFTVFGYQSSYENIYFYQAVLAYADIKEYCGDTQKAQEYRELAEKVRQTYNDTFWDAEKGRYISCITSKGKKLDYGITFTNFMAAALGIASEEQIWQIYTWLDGERTVKGDTSKGDDIYYFGYSARANTLDFSAIDDNGYYWVTWNDDMYPYDYNGALHGAYGNQMQNGGTIFYISYYDILGRIAGVSADNGWQRMESILGQFHAENQLRLFPYPTMIGYQSGIIGEFPESGMVPTAFIDGFLGIAPGERGLTITPKLPSDMDSAGVRRYRFNDTVYEIRIERGAQAGTVKDGVVTVPAEGTWILTPEGRLELGGY